MDVFAGGGALEKKGSLSVPSCFVVRQDRVCVSIWGKCVMQWGILLSMAMPRGCNLLFGLPWRCLGAPLFSGASVRYRLDVQSSGNVFERTWVGFVASGAYRLIPRAVGLL